MKLVMNVAMIALGAFAGIAAGAEKADLVLPDADYCARRDADPQKCVIQDGPPHRHIVRKKRA